MLRTALVMLVGDRTRFLGIVFGLAFASLLITQQAGIFRGIMRQVYGPITDMPQAELWVADPSSPLIDVVDMIPDRELSNMRAVEGVAWAVPMNRHLLTARVPGGILVPCTVLGIDDATLIGAPLPQAMVEGSVDDLREPWSVIVDAHGAASKLAISDDAGQRPLRVGDRITVSGRELNVVGLCNSTISLMLYPTIYMLRSRCAALDGVSGRGFNFLLGGLAPGADPTQVCRRIDVATGLSALTAREMAARTEDYYLYHTGIPANFGIAVLLGFIVGGAIAGQTFHQFIHDNRRTFAAMKAMGMRNRQLVRMILAQAAIAAGVGYGLGVGTAALFGLAFSGSDLAFALEPRLLVFSFVSVLMISVLAALVSLRQVARLDPALVFRS